MEFDVINKLSMNILMTFQKRVFIHVAAGKERREKERERKRTETRQTANAS